MKLPHIYARVILRVNTAELLSNAVNLFPL